MDYKLTEEEQMIQEVAKTVAEEKIKPLREEMDRESQLSSEVRKEIGRSDLIRVFIPEEYEGLGMGMFGMCLATEQISIVDGGTATAYAANGLGAIPIILFGSEEQKQKIQEKWLIREAQNRAEEKIWDAYEELEQDQNFKTLSDKYGLEQGETQFFAQYPQLLEFVRVYKTVNR